MATEKSKILVFGGTGYIGNHMVKASINLGHSTYIYSRPNSTKINLLNEFQSMGGIVIKGELDDNEKLASVLREVDVVISALAVPQFLDQLKIIEAIKVAGNIKRFLPSDFGCEEDKVNVLPPFQVVLDKKKIIRRATEAAGIRYTFLSTNCFGSYFVNYLLRPYDQVEDVIVYGNGEAKAVLNYEEDIAIYTIKVATDPRTCNRVVIYRPPGNIISQLELISLWVALPHPHNIPVSIIHSVFVKGVTTNFDIGADELEASRLYPDLKITTVEQLLDIFLRDPPKPASAAFE